MQVLDQIVRERGVAPELVPMDNGPEMTTNAVRDWCRLGGGGRTFIEPGSPWQNPFVESIGSRVRDEVLSVEAFDSVLEAQTVIEDWRKTYNHKRPHGSLGWRTRAAFAATGVLVGFSVTLAVGIAAMFWGFIRASRPADTPPAHMPKPR